MADPLSLVVITIAIALIFSFGNGLNDAANSIATIVATRVLSFRTAAFLAMLFNIVGAFFFTVAVATTIGKGIVDPSVMSTMIILTGLIGAIFWVYLTTYFGLPISGTHALIGGIIGAAIVAAGFKAVIVSKVIVVAAFIAIAPIFGMISGFWLSLVVMWLFKSSSPKKINKYFKKLQLISASAYSLGHGTNDAQNSMGVIAAVLFVNGYLGSTFHVPFWVIITSYLTIGMGTLMGGWRVVKTMGMKITRLRPVNGFCAETAGAAVILLCTFLGVPVSTTHVICGSITGVGATKRLTAVRWRIARKIVWAWILTIPTSALVGAMVYYLSKIIF